MSALTLMTAACVLGGAAPAAAEDSLVCPQAASTRLLTANDGRYKVWLYQAPAAVYVCFASSGLMDGVLVVRTGIGGGLPIVTPDIDASECRVYLHLQDPVELAIHHEWHDFVPSYLCFGVDGTAVGVAIDLGDTTLDPNVELWLDGQTTALYYYCENLARDRAECMRAQDWDYAYRVI